MTVAYKKNSLGNRRAREQWSQASSADTAQTCTTDPAGDGRAHAQPRELRAVFVNYSGNATQDVTVTLNSGIGAAYDTLLATLSLVAEQDGFYLPEKPIPIMHDDQIDVTAPAGGGALTSQVIIITELDEV